MFYFSSFDEKWKVGAEGNALPKCQSAIRQGRCGKGTRRFQAHVHFEALVEGEQIAFGMSVAAKDQLVEPVTTIQRIRVGIADRHRVIVITGIDAIRAAANVDIVVTRAAQNGVVPAVGRDRVIPRTSGQGTRQFYAPRNCWLTFAHVAPT